MSPTTKSPTTMARRQQTDAGLVLGACEDRLSELIRQATGLEYAVRGVNTISPFDYEPITTLIEEHVEALKRFGGMLEAAANNAPE